MSALPMRSRSLSMILSTAYGISLTLRLFLGESSRDVQYQHPILVCNVIEKGFEETDIDRF